LHDIVAVCDRVAVLYEGEKVAEVRGGETSVDELVRLVVGGGSRAGVG
jgi:simple sugar transport system ATP-binding protein